MSLIIKAKFYNKSNNIVIDYSDTHFVKNQKEITKSGTLYRKGNKLSYKLTGALNTTDNSDENTNYINDQRLISLVSIEKKEGLNFIVDCGDWSKDLLELMEQPGTYFLYKGSTIENFMKDKHRYHILSQGDIIKIGKIYLKVLHVKLMKEKEKYLKTFSNKDDNENNSSKNNSNELKEVPKEEPEKSAIKNNLIIEKESNDYGIKSRNKKNDVPQSKTEAHKINFGNFNSNKAINRSMIMTQKLNLTPRSIDINTINDANIQQLKKTPKLKKSRNKNAKNKKSTKSKNNIIQENKPKNLEILNKICRICLSGESNPTKNPLICPCTCKGSMKYIHYLCLKNWLNLKVESDLGNVNFEIDRPTITYSTNDICCELCKSQFPDYVKHNGKLYNVTFYKPKYDQFIVLESIRNDNRRTKFIHIIPLNNYSMHRIGRLNTCDLSLPDSSISRVHCCFYIENNQLVLENNSKFGTKVLIQKQKINMVYDYPLCIETQNTYLKMYIQKKFDILGCLCASTRSQIKMYPYQNQNQKGFDLFCSMVFKDEDEDSDKEENKEEDKEENKEEKEEEKENEEGKIKKIENNKEEDQNNNSKVETANEQLKNDSKSIKEAKKIDIINENKKDEKNLINIKINDDTPEANSKKHINIKDELIDNINDSKINLIDEDNNETINNNLNKKYDAISNKEKDNLINEIKLNDIKNPANFNKTMCNLISNFDNDIVKINNKDTENPNEHLKQLESEITLDKEKKNVINFFNNNDIQTIKIDMNKLNEEKQDIGTNINFDYDNSKLYKSINLDEINNLSYRKVNKFQINNTSIENNYKSIYGLISDDKINNSQLFAPKHNKNIKFDNYDIHFESEKVNNQKSAKKIWNKFNWKFK